MLTSIRIQNFRSIRDAEVKLGQVNLFIGPNNSGKSNFLKGITMLGAYLTSFPKSYPLTQESFQTLLPRENSAEVRKDKIMRFATQLSANNSKAISLIIGYAYNYEYNYEDEGKFVRDLSIVPTIDSNHDFRNFFDDPGYPDEEHVPTIIWQAQKIFANVKLYKFEPSSFLFSTEISDQPFLDGKGTNITSFLYSLSQNHEDQFALLRADLARCVESLTSVSTPPDPNHKGNIRLKFFDKTRRSYWAEEVSEGVLYFLALLCIVHQPNPPKLILLEEPEKGIHPRRIKEVMNFIFELAELRDIQIIISSHSPYVVDHFADISECISVFDRKDGETVVRNANDLINETNNELIEKGHKPIRYTDSLGEYWVSGFLGGVPI